MDQSADMPCVSDTAHRFKSMDADLRVPQRLQFTPPKDPPADEEMDETMDGAPTSTPWFLWMPYATARRSDMWTNAVGSPR